MNYLFVRESRQPLFATANGTLPAMSGVTWHAIGPTQSTQSQQKTNRSIEENLSSSRPTRVHSKIGVSSWSSSDLRPECIAEIANEDKPSRLGAWKTKQSPPKYRRPDGNSKASCDAELRSAEGRLPGAFNDVNSTRRSTRFPGLDVAVHAQIRADHRVCRQDSITRGPSVPCPSRGGVYGLKKACVNYR